MSRPEWVQSHEITGTLGGMVEWPQLSILFWLGLLVYQSVTNAFILFKITNLLAPHKYQSN